MDVYLVRVTQSVLRHYTSREESRQMSERIVQAALDHWNVIEARYGMTDEFDLMEKFAKECVRLGVLRDGNPASFLS